jgi:glycosyltransferase involved in cell wall biosynthesis
MRIVQVINHAGLDRGGAERLARGLHEDLVAAGHDAHIVALERCDTVELRNATTLGFTNPRDPRTTLALGRTLRSLARPGTVVHGHLFPTTLHLSLLARAGSLNMPLSMTEHSTWNRRRSRAAWRVLDRVIYDRFDRVIAISEEARTSLVDAYGHLAARTITVRNGARLRFTDPVIRPAAGGMPTILTVARLAPAKDLETALEALARIQDRPWRYLIAGDGERRVPLEERAKALGLGDRVTFLGHVEDVGPLLTQADLFLLPSKWEGFGLAAVEAMNAGLPVVCSDVPGLRDVVAPAGNPVVPPGDIEGFAKAVSALLDAPETRAELGAAGFSHAWTFDKAAMTEGYLAVWRELAGEMTT